MYVGFCITECLKELDMILEHRLRTLRKTRGLCQTWDVFNKKQYMVTTDNHPFFAKRDIVLDIQISFRRRLNNFVIFGLTFHKS